MVTTISHARVVLAPCFAGNASADNFGKLLAVWQQTLLSKNTTPRVCHLATALQRHSAALSITRMENNGGQLPRSTTLVSIHYQPETLKEKLQRRLRWLCCFGVKDQSVEFELMEKERRRRSRHTTMCTMGRTGVCSGETAEDTMHSTHHTDFF